MTLHSPIGASSMSRWSACPGSVRLSAGLPKTQTKYAEGGTEAHAFAHLLLKNNTGLVKWRPASQYIGQTLVFPECKVLVTEELAEDVQTYLNYVESKIAPGDVLLVEHEFNLAEIYPGCWGTADVVIWKPAIETLVVVDFKYGAGVFVSVWENPQLKYYGLGVLVTTTYRPKKVELVIVQPRIECPEGPIRSQTIDAMELLDFSVDLKDYAKATEAQDAPLVTGPQCRFCPAARICPALTANTQELAKMEFRQGLSYDPEKLSLALRMIPSIEAQIKAIDAFAYQEAEAGRIIPGFKLVEKRPTRKWKEEAIVEKALLQYVSKRSDLFEPHVLKSPAQMEKIVNKKLVEPYVEAISSGHTLVPESDKRPAVRPSAAEVFTEMDFSDIKTIAGAVKQLSSPNPFD